MTLIVYHNPSMPSPIPRYWGWNTILQLGFWLNAPDDYAGTTPSTLNIGNMLSHGWSRYEPDYDVDIGL